jgi:large subunit ribosomal protein L13
MSTPIVPVKPQDRSWYVVDAQVYPLGRLASHVAAILRGKHRPEYSPHQDHGDHVVVVNASRVRLTGKKRSKKTYFRHTGYLGGVRIQTLEEVMAKAPEEVVRRAVRGMLPKTRLGRSMIKKLKVYPGADHPHRAQNPVSVRITRLGFPEAEGPGNKE